MKGNIDEWMDEMVPLSHIFVFLATQKSVFNSPDCGREIRLSEKYGLLQVPLRTEEVKWEDIGKIGLPTEGFEYPQGKAKKVFKKLKEFIQSEWEKMEKLKKALGKKKFMNLSSIEPTLALESGEATKLGQLLIKCQQIKGFISQDGKNFLSDSQVKHMIKLYQKQRSIDSVSDLMEKMNIDPIYENEFEALVLKVQGKKSNPESLVKNEKSKKTPT
jgi:hypothetical protein